MKVVCKKCKKKVILKKKEAEEAGMVNWKCPHCYTIQPFKAVFRVKWNCSLDR